MRRVIATGTATIGLPGQLERARSHPQLRDLIISWYPVRITATEVVGVGCIAEDVTERLRTEREREKFVVELHEAVRARDDFLSIASHELRTPLTTLMLGAEHLVDLLRQRIPSRRWSSFRAGADRLQKQGQRLERLVGTLLDVARIAQGRVQLFPEELDVALRRPRPGRAHQRELRGVGLVITVDAPGSRPRTVRPDTARADRRQPRVERAQVRGQASRSSVALDASHEAIRLTVRDQGVGIAKEDRAGSSSASSKRSPSATTAASVSASGSRARSWRRWAERFFVTGELGQGSTFIVEWPRLT